MTALTLPDVVEKVNVVRRQRAAQGLCTDFTIGEPRVLRDDDLGVFIRFRFVFPDGAVVEVDSLEAGRLVAPLVSH